ncbi:NAD(P)/FAD-dependent oxidoreductase [Marinobacterium mangrovicola]|uniref:Gamma-glutamylputrescine oxidase n=1 Tax=Marinobacterium mangrovicola TaxID=1476959 RepID=A0A4R1GG60_9GAMM|nr:FAD-binding oxidoreductase [Marinobacterium mangrovicola]TCK07437.1 gamma-glutamylputrescine oxidase [Marinobacterium mangrovicola]
MKDPVHSNDYPNSFYTATARYQKERPSLSGSLEVDVCVVGGGFSGVNTALELAERGFSVALLEAKRVGWGASGRNGGELIRGIGHGVDQFRDQIGDSGVEALGRMGIEAVDIVRKRVERYSIDCDLQMGYCDLALKPRHMDEMAAEREELEALGYGYDLKILDRDEVGQVIGSNRYLGAMVDMGSGHLHPLNLVLGEAVAAEEAGVQIFEYSPAEKIIKGDRPRVVTPNGEVSCNYLVLCGNAYIGHKLESHIGGKVLPAGSYVIATEPLSEAQSAEIIPQNMAFADLSVALDYFHLSADRRLLFGGLCNYSGKDPRDITGALRPNLERVFPQLKGVKIDFEWGGMIGIGANRLPQVGRLPDAPNILFAQAYAGHGVNATHMAAKVIAEMLSGQAERFDVFDKVKHMTFPGGPALRSPLLAMGMLYYRMKDLL